MIWFLFAILALVAQGQVDSCKLKYYTVNTFKEQNNFTFLCYGNGEDCDVYYAPRGKGCDGDWVTFIGTVPEDERKVLSSEDDFSLGGGFCANNQIGVYHADNSGQIIAHLPRATEAGTGYIFPRPMIKSSENYSCSVFALSSPARVEFFGRPFSLSYNVEAFDWRKFDPFIYDVAKEVLKMISDTPVIVSCTGERSSSFATMQPIANDNFLIPAYKDNVVAIVLTHCENSDVYTDFSRQEVRFAEYQTGSACQYTREDTDDTQIFRIASLECVLYIRYSYSACVSVTVLKDGVVVDSGRPDTRFFTRFVMSDQAKNVAFFSHSERPCFAFDLDNQVEYIGLTEIGGESLQSTYVSFADWTIKSTISRVHCERPVLMIERDPSNQISFLSGYQSEELWYYINPDIECAEELTPALTDALSLTPAQTKGPSSSNALVFYSSISLATFVEVLFFLF